MQLYQSKKVLFLIRTYNDLDHIAPVIWKMASSGFRFSYLLTSREFFGDYRIQITEKVGARQLGSVCISRYYKRLRSRIRVQGTTEISRLNYFIDYRFLVFKRHDIGCVIIEWTVANERETVAFFLRAARALRLPTIAIPHGYHTWLSNNFTRQLVKLSRRLENCPSLLIETISRHISYKVKISNVTAQSQEQEKKKYACWVAQGLRGMVSTKPKALSQE